MSPGPSIAGIPSRGEYPWADARRGVRGRLGRALGIRRSFAVDGVRYREVTTEPLRSALSRRGPGYKDFDVRFRGGDRMRIRCTRERVFADLAPPPRLPVLLRIERLLRPGMRVLVTACGTGYGAAMVAGRVSPSGAVVALDPDQESIDFAQRRYAIQNVSFERGGISDLRGETDGAFEAVIVLERTLERPDDASISEYWRLVAPGGWLAVAHASSNGDNAADSADRTAALAAAMLTICIPVDSGPMSSSAHVGPLGDGRDGWIAAVARRDIED
jgi:SAM-dependent methyltransferase